MQGGGRQARGMCAKAVGQERPWHAEAVKRPAWWGGSEGGEKVPQVAEGRQQSHLTGPQELSSRILGLIFSAGDSTDTILFCQRVTVTWEGGGKMTFSHLFNISN